MPTATSDNPELTTPEVGPTTSADSAKSQELESNPLPVTDVELVKEGAALRRMGLSRGAAMRLLAAGGDGKWLNTKITGRVNATFYANSLEQLAKAQEKAVRMSADSEIDARTRVAALQVAAQCGVAIARTGEANLSNALRLDDPGKESAKPAPVQNNTLIYGFPPVAQPKPSEQLQDAKTGIADNSKA